MMQKHQKQRMIYYGTLMLSDKIKLVKAVEALINTAIFLLEIATKWQVKNKPIKLEIDDTRG